MKVEGRGDLFRRTRRIIANDRLEGPLEKAFFTPWIFPRGSVGSMQLVDGFGVNNEPVVWFQTPEERISILNITSEVKSLLKHLGVPSIIRRRGFIASASRR